MTVRFNRYAIYFAPEDGSTLDRLGTRYLGWDTSSGKFVDHATVPCLPVPISEITKTPRKYGIHGTLKPPFIPLAGVTIDQIEDTLTNALSDFSAFPLPPIQLSKLGTFLALTLSESSAPLAVLAAICVQSLDQFRTRPSADELARRRSGGLTPAEDANLQLWGYPYVMNEFRFHITLTGQLHDDHIDQAKRALRAYFEPVLFAQHHMRDVCIFGEDEAGQFHLLRRLPLNP